MLVWQIGENASFDPSVLKLNRKSTSTPPQLRPQAIYKLQTNWEWSMNIQE
jgi:hypothetical protein